MQCFQWGGVVDLSFVIVGGITKPPEGYDTTIIKPHGNLTDDGWRRGFDEVGVGVRLVLHHMFVIMMMVGKGRRCWFLCICVTMIGIV